MEVDDMEESTDIIFVRNLRVRTRIGISPEESAKPQEVLISYRLYVDTRAAGDSDQLEDAVNYRSVTKALIDLAESSRFSLVERLAESAAQVCLSYSRVSGVDITVEKPGCLRFADSAGVTIMRRRS
jgi:D-erythro-7,8-dihydroneopterin triphosphate epimerase